MNTKEWNRMFFFISEIFVMFVDLENIIEEFDFNVCETIK